MPLKTKYPLSPHLIAVWMGRVSGGHSVFFFFRSAVPSIVLFLGSRSFQFRIFNGMLIFIKKVEGSPAISRMLSAFSEIFTPFPGISQSHNGKCCLRLRCSAGSFSMYENSRPCTSIVFASCETCPSVLLTTVSTAVDFRALMCILIYI